MGEKRPRPLRSDALVVVVKIDDDEEGALERLAKEPCRILDGRDWVGVTLPEVIAVDGGEVMMLGRKWSEVEPGDSGDVGVCSSIGGSGDSVYIHILLSDEARAMLFDAPASDVVSQAVISLGWKGMLPSFLGKRGSSKTGMTSRSFACA